MPCRDVGDVGCAGDVGQVRPVGRGARLARASSSRSGAAVKGGQDAEIGSGFVATIGRVRPGVSPRILKRPGRRSEPLTAAQRPPLWAGMVPVDCRCGLGIWRAPFIVSRGGRHPCPSGERSSPNPRRLRAGRGRCHPAARAAAMSALMRRNSSRREASRSVSAAAAASSRAKPRPGLRNPSASGSERSRA